MQEWVPFVSAMRRQPSAALAATGENAGNSREGSVAECRLANSRGADVRIKIPDTSNGGDGTGEHVRVQPVLKRQRTQVQGAKKCVSLESL